MAPGQLARRRRTVYEPHVKVSESHVPAFGQSAFCLHSTQRSPTHFGFADEQSLSSTHSTHVSS
jgi:hypothetical protein